MVPLSGSPWTLVRGLPFLCRRIGNGTKAPAWASCLLSDTPSTTIAHRDECEASHTDPSGCARRGTETRGAYRRPADRDRSDRCFRPGVAKRFCGLGRSPKPHRQRILSRAGCGSPNLDVHHGVRRTLPPAHLVIVGDRLRGVGTHTVRVPSDKPPAAHRDGHRRVLPSGALALRAETPVVEHPPC